MEGASPGVSWRTDSLCLVPATNSKWREEAGSGECERASTMLLSVAASNTDDLPDSYSTSNNSNDDSVVGASSNKDITITITTVSTILLVRARTTSRTTIKILTPPH